MPKDVSLQKKQSDLFTARWENPSKLLEKVPAYYTTQLGAAYLIDSQEILAKLPDDSLDLIFTSPPYALHFKKEYGNVDKNEYVEWFLGFAREFKRVLKDEGSFVLNVGGTTIPGTPTRSLYHFKLLIALVEELGFHLAQECFWYDPAKMPVPAEWVTVRRVASRIASNTSGGFRKDTLSEGEQPQGPETLQHDMIRLNQRGVRATVRPSGHNIRSGFDKIESGGSIPANVVEQADAPEAMLKFGNNAANDPYTKKCKEQGIKIHPARFPRRSLNSL